jgi:soluble lytic murein transglycosylase-like protein
MTMYRHYNNLIAQNKTFKIISLTTFSFAVMANFSSIAIQADTNFDRTTIDIASIRDAHSDIIYDISPLLIVSTHVNLKIQPVPEIPPSPENPKILFYYNIIENAAKLHRVDPDIIRAIIMVESRYKAGSISKKSANGLMQLMPRTAATLGVKNILDPKENIFAGTKYFRHLLNRFDENVELALASYNAGPSKVIRHDGIPPYKETQNFVKNVFQYYAYYKVQSLEADRIKID